MLQRQRVPSKSQALGEILREHCRLHQPFLVRPGHGRIDVAAALLQDVVDNLPRHWLASARIDRRIGALSNDQRIGGLYTSLLHSHGTACDDRLVRLRDGGRTPTEAAVNLAGEPIIVIGHLLKKLLDRFVARLLLSRTLHKHTLGDPLGPAVFSVPVHFLPGRFETEDTSLLPGRHAAVLARLLPQLAERLLVLLEGSRHGLRKDGKGAAAMRKPGH